MMSFFQQWDDGYFLFVLMLIAIAIVVGSAIHEARKDNDNNKPSTT